MVIQLLHKLRTSSDYKSVEEVNNDIDTIKQEVENIINQNKRLKHEMNERDNHIMRLVVENRELRSNGIQ